MKRTLSFTLALLCLASAVSCGEAGSKPENTTAPTGSETAGITGEAPADGLPDTDMDGFKFTILHSDSNSISWVNHQLDAEAENGEILNDAIFKRNSYIEDRFNCDLNYAEDEVNAVTSIMREAVMAGDSEYDIVFLYGVRVMKNLDLISDMSKLPYINLDKEWWNPKATETFNIAGKQLAVAGNYTLSYLSSAGCFLFNKNLYADLRIKDNVYDLVREGKWTTDKFFELAKYAEADLNGDSKMSEGDRMGSTGESTTAFYGNLIQGANIKYAEKDSDGYPCFALKGNEKAIGLIQKIISNVSKDPYLYFTTTTDVNGEDEGADFDEGECLFLQTRINSIEKFRDMKDDFGILPAPKYDEAQESYVTRTGIGEIATLPLSCDAARFDNIGMLLEAMAAYSHMNIIPVYKEVLLETKYARDTDSSDMLDHVFGGITFDFGEVQWEGVVSNVLMKEIFIPKSDKVVSTIEAISASVEAEVEDLKEAIAGMQ